LVPAAILSVGVEGSNLYVGTDDGVWELGTGLGAAATRLAGENTIISDIGVQDSNDYAFLGPYYLYLRKSSGTETTGGSLVGYPFVAGFPGNPNDVAWNGNAVYITGDEGIVYIP
jgi:hypothetical protein